jgi:hypothetical protein
MGFTVSNLDELSNKLKSLSLEEYKKMKTNANLVRTKIISGGYLNDTINHALKIA